MKALLRNERGAALAMALLFLMVLSILVAVLHRTTISEILFSRNYQEGQKAFYAAESGLREGLRQCRKDSTPPKPTWYSPYPNTVPSSWSPKTPLGEVSFHYNIQFVGNTHDPNFGADKLVPLYRITAEGMNSDGSVVKRVQIVTTAN